MTGTGTLLAICTQKLISGGAWANDTLTTAAKLSQAIIKERVRL